MLYASARKGRQIFYEVYRVELKRVRGGKSLIEFPRVSYIIYFLIGVSFDKARLFLLLKHCFII